MFKMTRNVLRNLFYEKATRLYPGEARLPFDNARGELVNSQESCNFCGICASKCPSQCIGVQKKAATWTYNPFACVYCGVCVEVCPQESLHQERGYKAAVLEPEIVTIVGETKEPRPNGRGF